MGVRIGLAHLLLLLGFQFPVLDTGTFLIPRSILNLKWSGKKLS